MRAVPVVNRVRSAIRQWRAEPSVDRGAVLPLVLVMIVLGALVVLPTMTYAVSVLRANQVEHERLTNVEAAKAGVRVALRDPSDVFNLCDEANGLPLVADPEIDGKSVSVSCTEVSELGSSVYFGLPASVGMIVTQVGPTEANASGIPADDSVDGHLATYEIATGAAPPPYPTTFDLADQPGVPAWNWWSEYAWTNPLDDDDTRGVWQPALPPVPDADRESDPFEMDGFDCVVYLPGRYDEALVLDGSHSSTNYYFASGVYYFEQPVTISNGVDVVVGQGIADFGVSNECADDIQVAYNLQDPPDRYAMNGGGATFVLGDQGRLVVNESGGAPRVDFNQRYANEGSGAWVSIISVNGDHSFDADLDNDDAFESPVGDQVTTNVNFVERSMVLPVDDYDPDALVSIDDPAYSYFTPSHPDLTDEAWVPEAPTILEATPAGFGSAPTNGAIVVRIAGVEQSDTNGALIDEYRVVAQTSNAFDAPEAECTTSETPASLVPVVEPDGAENSVGEDASNPDAYSCVLTGLAPDQTYFVGAQASNEAGPSVWAERSVEIPASPTALTSPTSPDDVVVEQLAGEPTTALVSWDASTAGSPTDRYEVSVYRVSRADCSGLEDWDTNCNNVCDDDERSQPWDTNCNNVCDPGEPDPAWDLNCNGVCEAGETSDDIADGCEPACVNAPSWDANCNGTCDLDERGAPWDDNCDGVCDVGEQSEGWDTDCDGVCGVDERAQPWDANCNGTCDTGEPGAVWDTDCDGVCDVDERSEAWDTDCDGVCGADERSETWDDNCNGTCDSDEGCSTCDAWDKDCDGVCDAWAGWGDADWDWDWDCDGICDTGGYYAEDEVFERNGGSCDDACAFSESWDTDCDAVCDGSEDCYSDCDYHDDACNAEVRCDDNWDANCNGVCEIGIDHDADCDGRCDFGEDCTWFDFIESWDWNWNASCDSYFAYTESCHPDCGYHDDACNAACSMVDFDDPCGFGGFSLNTERTPTVAAMERFLEAQPDGTFYEEVELIDGVECSSVPYLDPDGVEEWRPARTECTIPGLDDLNPSDGWTGYRFEVTAVSDIAGASPAAQSATTGTSLSTLDEGTVETAETYRVVYPRVPTSIIDIDASGGGALELSIPGFVSVPMGRISVDNSNPNGDEIALKGGVVAGTFHLAAEPSASESYGYAEDVVLQRTVNLTAVSGGVRSTATVRINADNDTYGIEYWVTQ